MKIAVVGLGAIGSQVLWQLSKLPGIEAHGYDSHYPGHPTAGAGGDSRLFWNLELKEPAYAPLIVRAGQLWKELESEANVPLRDRTGVLVFGSRGSEQLDRAIASAEDTGARIELLDNGELTRRFAQFRFDGDAVGAWDVDGAVIRPELSVAKAAEIASANGAIVHDFTRVTRIDFRDDGVSIGVEGRTENFDRVVVACGGWTPTVLPYLKDEVVVRRLTSVWFFGAEADYLKTLPPFLQTPPSYCYGIPTADARAVKLGLGFNDHYATGDPDSLPRELYGESLEEQVSKFSWVREHLLPGLRDMPFRVNTYVESYTRSMMEYVRFHPESKNLVVLTGFSGHGFRAAPAIGEIGAEMAVHGRSTLDVSFLETADPVFDILDPATGAATHNPVMASAVHG